MKPTLNLKEFLTEGRLGPITLGLERDRIISLIGEPDHWSEKSAGQSKEEATRWRYGCMFIGFLKRRGIQRKGLSVRPIVTVESDVTAMGLYFNTGYPLPEVFHAEGYFPHGETKLTEFETYLRNEAIEFEGVENNVNAVALVTNADVAILARYKVTGTHGIIRVSPDLTIENIIYPASEYPFLRPPSKGLEEAKGNGNTTE